jgi:putative endopeptidase
MDEAAVEALDAKPLTADLAAIQAVKTKTEFAALMAKTHGGYGLSFFAIQVDADAKKPVSTLYIGQDGLGMPDRDYYLTDAFKDKKAAYNDYILRTLKMINYAAPEAAASAILALETRIAEVSWAVADRRDIDKLYNPMSVQALQAYAPAVDWRFMSTVPAPRA